MSPARRTLAAVGWTSAILALGICCARAHHRVAIVDVGAMPGPDASDGFPLPVRSASAGVSMLLMEGYQRSPTLKQLIDAIGRTNGIVYIQTGRCPIHELKGCLLHVIHGTRDVRYLWIRIRPSAEPMDLLSGVAHELQHAFEVLQDPSIRTPRDLLQFYRSPQAHAYDSSPPGSPFQSYETGAAIAAAATVRSELTAFAANAFDAEGRSEAPIPP